MSAPQRRRRAWADRERAQQSLARGGAGAARRACIGIGPPIPGCIIMPGIMPGIPGIIPGIMPGIMPGAMPGRGGTMPPGGPIGRGPLE